MLSGHADYAFDSPTPSQLREIELRSPGLLYTEPLPDTDFLDLNTHAAPFNDLRVRQALNFAADRNVIARLYGGLDAPPRPARSSSPRSPGTSPTAPTPAHHLRTGVGRRQTCRAHAS